MRIHLLGLLLLATVAAPVGAQRNESPERRLQRLEQEMRAVQRRVFPGGRTQFVEPEIEPQTTAAPPPGISADATARLNSRLEAVEAQLRSLTGQVEEQENRSRQLEEQLNRLRTDLQQGLARMEQQGSTAAPPAATSPAQSDEPPPEPADAGDATDEPAEPAAATDNAQEAYNAGFRLWDSRRYAEAQRALNAAATRYPNSRWASWARNLEGRAYLDDDKPATAARVFLANYQDNPRGERAADSLYYLGISLTRLNRRTEACRVYAELEQVYPNMRDYIRERLPQARTDARCGASSTR